ncbi:anthranilate synthase component I family protein [Niallia sp. SS-2023]|uniref:anthranilate synthase component I family protein n=1 Tax=Niallia sp. SS-2023 TaxID=3051155 RepID=UPI002549D99F|nr:anthranilate synthase component I family protein [Niallia sp. SS-2023]MDL0437332.1 anthranilate synthase component I family protein [Niallia sp. SS-2023]
MKKFKVFSKSLSISYAQFYEQFIQLSQESQYYAILESGRGGRYSIAAMNPIATMIGKDNTLEVVGIEGTTIHKGNPLHTVKQIMKEYEVEANHESPEFQGGAIGFISYDYIRYIEEIPNIAVDDLETPDVFFMLFDNWFVYDLKENKLWLSALYTEATSSEVEDRIDKAVEKLQENRKVEHQMLTPEKTMGQEVSIKDNEFQQSVRKIQEYISQGDVFQVNLSVRQMKSLNVSALEVYNQLRILNPSPYMGYFHTPDFQLVSGSPELLVKKKGEEVSTRPIAGTRSRGKDNDEDQKLADELINSEKERAEHVMLVDLERNDLGRVCEYGSVEVDEFMAIEKYSHVMHIVSNVRGKLAAKYDEYDLIDSMFPGGTITGAPKIRTMEIIEELEPVRRGPYTGSMGWIGFNKDIELNIMIRTMLVKDKKSYVQAGAGIVIDSVPSNEYKESMKKARALWNAKELAEEK